MTQPIAPHPTILIVDDTPANIGVLGDYLEEQGFRVVVAQDGEEGIQRARFSAPDLILLDVMMPGIDGLETCRRLKADESLRDIPVIFMTALAETADKIAGFAAGGVDYISKPFQIEEVLARIRTHLALRAMQLQLTEQNRELQENNRKLEELQHQLLQSEKMASIGQLAAGVAHEINNPIAFVSSNLGTLRGYIDDLLELIAHYERLEGALPAKTSLLDEVRQARDRLEFDYLREDVQNLLHESDDGVQRVRRIVQDLKDFSHAGEAERQIFDLHPGIDSTLNIARNEIRHKAEVKKEYGDLPPVEGVPAQLNQVFLNLLMNAAQAIDQAGTITIRTGHEKGWAWVEIADTGCGIPPEHMARIFEPFFTTKPIGKGTGLGLSLSYGIVVQHGGRIDVESKPGEGTSFKIWLPCAMPA
ncbi:MAG TPA: response regulator [Noviherbaspirillum sp.]|nr:response regulator [Noviherbaspirillum sp.]